MLAVYMGLVLGPLAVEKDAFTSALIALRHRAVNKTIIKKQLEKITLVHQLS